jgi:Pterin 4 alpha carbinolamine dehydratase
MKPCVSRADWELRDDAHRIERTFRFRNFREALAFVQRVGELAGAAACSRTSPGTRRQGLEAGAWYQAVPWLFYVNYALVDATYQFTGKLASPDNPSADADGNVLVTPGKHIPGIPLHQIKSGLDYAVTPA